MLYMFHIWSVSQVLKFVHKITIHTTLLYSNSCGYKICAEIKVYKIKIKINKYKFEILD